MTKAIPISAATNAGNGEVEPEVVEEAYQPITPQQRPPLAKWRAIDPRPRRRSRPHRSASHRAQPRQRLGRAITRGDAVSERSRWLSGAVRRRPRRGWSRFPASSLRHPCPAELSDDATDTRELAAAAERNILALTALGQVLERRRDPATPMAVILLTHMARHLPGDEVVPVSMASCNPPSSVSLAPSLPNALAIRSCRSTSTTSA